MLSVIKMSGMIKKKNVRVNKEYEPKELIEKEIILKISIIVKILISFTNKLWIIIELTK